MLLSSPVEGWTLIDLFVLAGVGVVLPLAMPSRGWWTAFAAAAVALALPDGWVAATFVLPWLTVAAVSAVRSWRRSMDALVAAYAVVAAGALSLSRLGWELFGIGEPIVELTAVHFTYAGCGALTLARCNLAAWSRSRTQSGPTWPGALAWGSVAATAVAPPVVALGFVTGTAMPQVGGAVLMSVGVGATSLLQLRAAQDPVCSTTVRLLLGASGLAAWVPMVLAVGWAVAQHVDVPALSIDDMVRVHGTLNGLGFVVCGLVGWRLRTRGRRESRVIGELVT
jgi:hypothetical protein